MTNMKSLEEILKTLLKAPKSALRIFRYIYLCLKSKAKGKVKCIFVGVERIAANCACSIRTVQYVLRRYSSLIFCMQRAYNTSLYDLHVDLVKALDFLDSQKMDLLENGMQKSRISKFIKKTLRSLTKNAQKLHHPPSKIAPNPLSLSSNLKREGVDKPTPLFNSEIQEIHFKCLSQYPPHIVDATLESLGNLLDTTIRGLMKINYRPISKPKAYCMVSARKNMMNALIRNYRKYKSRRNSGVRIS